ncbi:MAG: excinuclease ABC subunit C [Haliscomenobacteraceae bacterium CHB4]|nr:UvrABC system protein C [Saprospiraceae bacterium]MCE7921759.1 excinuclease ABC subunit C [Haliscomenobacteraceae bacterium CHB4]
MTNEQFKEFAPSIPTAPGIYKYLDAEGIILYVGKAKNLRNRLSSYFGDKKYQLAKTKVLVRHAHHIEFTIVETEHDALLLENSLIKKHQPRYNVMLKDEKSPLVYICIKRERFPRVFLTRKVIKDGSTYFGPYLQKFRVEQVAELIRKLFQLRTCTLHLSQENIEKQKFKPCLEYHIKNCAAPCVGLETEEDYNRKIEQIKNILKGNFAAVKNHLKEEMQRAAENLQFEQAQLLKEKLSLFEDYQGRSTVVSPNIHDVDVFAIADDEKEAFVNFLKVVNGAVIHTYTLTLTKNLDEDKETLLVFAIQNLRERFQSHSPEVIVPFPVVLPEKDVVVTVPKIGDKKKLLELSEKNGQYHLLQKKKQAATATGRQTHAERILRTLQADLHMEEVPLWIECFDNSNLQGTNPVSSCVVFKNAKPSKRDYRHYNVKSVEGPNDFASMEEVVYRRYKRLLAEGQGLPQLVIIDGGKGQLSAAMKSLRALGLEGKMTVVGIAKRLEEIFFPDDPVPALINKKSESLKLIQQARNEAHRFGITFHRNQRSKNFIKTELTEIAGIGAKTAEKLLQHFGSLARVRAAERAEVEKIVGKVAAGKVASYFSEAAENEEHGSN